MIDHPTSPVAAPAKAGRQNPYVGPVAFREDQSKLFFGREWEISELFNRLVAYRIVLLHAPSGAGKSSLVEAGLRPLLKQEEFTVLPTTRVNEEPLSEIDATAPGFNRYIFSVLHSLDCQRGEGQQLDLHALSGMTLSNYLASLDETDDPVSRVLIIDQFEEIITTAATDREGKLAFFEQLGQALNDPYLSALFVTRDEYLGALEPFQNYLPTQLKNTFRLDLLGKDAAMKAVREPLNLQGIEFLEPAARSLVENLSQVKSQKTTGEWETLPGLYVEPVQLQVVCLRLYDRLGLATDLGKTTIDEVDRSQAGDVDRALQEYYADEVIKPVNAGSQVTERQVRRWFDKQLITKSGSRSQVLLEEGKSGGLNNTVIASLVDAHLVRSENRRGATWFELAHDRLIQPVREDNREWFKKNLSFWQMRAEEWEEKGRPPDLLLGRLDLTRAETGRSTNAEDLTDAETDFLTESRSSVSQHARSRRTRRLLLILSGMILAVLLALVAVFVDSRNNQNRAAVNSRKLANLYGFISASRDPFDGIGKLVTAIRSGEIAVEGEQEDVTGAHHALFEALQSTGGERLTSPSAGLQPGTPLLLLEMDANQRWLAGADAEGRIYLWDLSSSMRASPPVVLETGAGAVTALEFVDLLDLKLAVAFDNGGVFIWKLDPLDRQPLSLREGPGRVNALESEGIWLAAGSSVAIDIPDDKSNLVTLWNLACPTPVPVNLDLTDYYPTPVEDDATRLGLELVDDAVNDLAFNLGGTLLLAGGVHDQAIAGENKALLASWDLTGADDCPASGLPVARRWELAMPAVIASNPETYAPVEIPQGAITVLTVNPHLPQVAAAFENNSLWLSDIDAPGEFLPLAQHAGLVRALEFVTPRGFLASASDDGKIYLWGTSDLAAYYSDPNVSLLQQELAHNDAVSDLEYGLNGRWLVSGSADQTVRMWDLAADPPGSDVKFLAAQQGAVTAVAAARDGNLAASAGMDGSVRLWDLTSTSPASLPVTLSPMAGDFFFGGFSANSAISTRSVFIFPQPGSNSLLHPDFQPGFWVGIGESPSAAGFASIQVNNLVPGDYTLSPQGDWLAVVNGDGEGNGGQPQVRLYHQGELGDEVHLAGSLTVEDLPVLKLFDHGSDWLLLQGSSPWLKLVSLAGDQAQPFDLPDLGWPVLSAAFSPDGRWLALGGPEGQGAVWDLAKLQAGETRSGDLLPGPDHEFTTEEASPICALAFRPKQTFPFVRIRSFNWTTSGDDQLLAIAGAPGTIYTWDPDRPDPDAGVLELVSNEMEQDQQATLPPPDSLQVDSEFIPTDWEGLCPDRPNRLAFSPDGRWLAVSTLMTNTDSTGGSFTNGKIYLADLFESDRSTFGRVALWLNDYLDDFKVEERPVWSSRQEIGRIRTLGFDSNSRWLFTGDIPVEGNPSPGGIWMWSLADLDNPAARLYMPVTAGGVSEIAFSDNGWLIARSPDSVVRLWRLDLKELVDMACTVMGRQATLNELRFYLRAENWTETSERICNR